VVFQRSPGQSFLATFLTTLFFLPIPKEFRHVMIWPAITARDHGASELLGNVIGFLPHPEWYLVALPLYVANFMPFISMVYGASGGYLVT